MTEWYRMSALELAEGIRTRAFSSEEVTSYFLDRIPERQEQVGAFALFTPKTAPLKWAFFPSLKTKSALQRETPGTSHAPREDRVEVPVQRLHRECSHWCTRPMEGAPFGSLHLFVTAMGLNPPSLSSGTFTER